MGRQPMRIADSCMKKEKEKGKAFQKIDKIQNIYLGSALVRNPGLIVEE